jgi:NADPH2:quinone reductase
MPVVRTAEANTLRLTETADSIEGLVFELAHTKQPKASPKQAVISVRSAAVNPSDVKAALGLMPHAAWPRVPGRDYAGVVVDGPTHWIGREVWGSGGDLGITRDGSHAAWLSVPVQSLRAKPRTLTLDEAGTVGVPFVTAYEGFRRSGMPKRGQIVLVLGANGKVGQAAVQLAVQAGARVIAVQRKAGRLPGWTPEGVDMLDASSQAIAARVRVLTGGHGVDIVFNTVGSPYFQAANDAMAKGATQIFIATQERAVPFDIFAFYRGTHTYVGVDSLALDCTEAAVHLEQLGQGFEAGTLRPFEVASRNVYGIDRALEAYRTVLAGVADRIVLRP